MEFPHFFKRTITIAEPTRNQTLNWRRIKTSKNSGDTVLILTADFGCSNLPALELRMILKGTSHEMPPLLGPEGLSTAGSPLESDCHGLPLAPADEMPSLLSQVRGLPAFHDRPTDRAASGPTSVRMGTCRGHVQRSVSGRSYSNQVGREESESGITLPRAVRPRLRGH